MRAKLGGVYVQSTIYGIEARAEGYDEALFLNLEGNVAEGPGENLFIVKDGVVRTNDRSESILEGITRTSILEIARDLGISDRRRAHHQGRTSSRPTKPSSPGRPSRSRPSSASPTARTRRSPKTEHAIGSGNARARHDQRLREAYAGDRPGSGTRSTKSG